MDIHIKVVSKEEIKLRKGFTGADWWWDYWGNLQIRIEKMEKPEYEKALSIHELLEAMHCQLLGITEKQVDEFDEVFEKEHPDKHGLEAGDAPGCPYAAPHSFATAPERVYEACAGICHKEYDDYIGSL
jgi:hypothetical protein